ncbi:uncharacterized protein MONOS_12224c2 [Monocercomonoides exilis]|uniref:uncharacterized protein n=1 Tax=Monocercomonoides exilis TaxID=2049356 RepID=UPI0035595D63|nr:hypothetical protein MONOS_12224c1 [Monocercomonoides exilis]KAH7815576.1 hypothetical protein MONOS_12224c2 [Monocercomonoides exilis]|eukprot:MONOS_12224.1-p1 / transcript=MONOS_12224.1 / gene=MONOS_12224 / organism=Monocercomonoides_exilis_PA203 / gene_product=unspecified product / transcript_product=unspecified product / location=Mono_scaffold00662:4339-5222(+) / protein_length=175 / sequence_SO=supercontig / SO=protein_coding / is_pseudo=false
MRWTCTARGVHLRRVVEAQMWRILSPSVLAPSTIQLCLSAGFLAATAGTFVGLAEKCEGGAGEMRKRQEKKISVSDEKKGEEMGAKKMGTRTEKKEWNLSLSLLSSNHCSSTFPSTTDPTEQMGFLCGDWDSGKDGAFGAKFPASSTKDLRMTSGAPFGTFANSVDLQLAWSFS